MNQALKSRPGHTLYDPSKVYQFDKIELDMKASHGQVAARALDGKNMRVAGAIEVAPDTGPGRRPIVDSLAPLFRAVTYDGTMVDLEALAGKKVWLIFYRYATCPLCNLHLQSVIRAYPAIQKAGMEVLVVFESAVPQFYLPGKTLSTPFPIIADPKKLLYTLYGTRKSLLGLFGPRVFIEFIRARFAGFRQGAIEGELTQMPSHFLIDDTGHIRWVHHGKTAVDHLSWHKVGLFGKISSRDLFKKSA